MLSLKTQECPYMPFAKLIDLISNTLILTIVSCECTDRITIYISPKHWLTPCSPDRQTKDLSRQTGVWSHLFSLQFLNLAPEIHRNICQLIGNSCKEDFLTFFKQSGNILASHVFVCKTGMSTTMLFFVFCRNSSSRSTMQNFFSFICEPL